MYTEWVEPANKIPNKLLIYFVLLFGLFGAAFVAGYIFEKNPGKEDIGGVDEPNPKEVTETMVSKVGIPIRKLASPDGKVLFYWLKGSFPGGLEINTANGSYPVLEGEFVFQSDPLERRIPTMIGAGSGKINFSAGTETRIGTESGEVRKWGVVEVMEIADMIKPGDQVELKFSLTSLSQIRRMETVLIQIYGEYDKGEFGETVIPLDFRLFPEAMGVLE